MLTKTAHCDGSSFPKGQGQSDVAHVPSMGPQASRDLWWAHPLNGFLEEAADQTGRACQGHSQD